MNARQGAFILSLVAGLASGTSVAAQDAVNGERLFRQRCAPCHVNAPTKKSTIGPNLAGIIGREAGRVPDFVYSKAMKNARLRWTRETLDRYLNQPPKMIPGSRMQTTTPAQKDRADIIGYLATIKSK